jgi:hypothetical protein
MDCGCRAVQPFRLGVGERKAEQIAGFGLVERTGIEPVTPCLQSRLRSDPDSTSC